MKGILCFGDSITFGCGEQPTKGWVGRLKEWFERLDEFNFVYNLGVPGHTSDDLVKRFLVEAHGRLRFSYPSEYVCIIAIGTNDAKLDVTKEGNKERTRTTVFEQNIKILMRQATELKAKTVFVGLPPVDESLTQPYEKTLFTNQRVAEFNDITKRICKKYGFHFIDMFALMKEQNYTEMLDDGLHPDGTGYDFMFENIKQYVEKLI